MSTIASLIILGNDSKSKDVIGEAGESGASDLTKNSSTDSSHGARIHTTQGKLTTNNTSNSTNSSSTSNSTSTLASLASKSSFTQLTPDKRIQDQAIALKNEKNIIHTPRILLLGAFSWTVPEKRAAYKYLTSSPKALEDLKLDPEQDEEFKSIVSGEIYHEDFVDKFPVPYSQAYAGWQFGQFAGQLGDGRVMNLFEMEKQVKPGNDPVDLAKNVNLGNDSVDLNLARPKLPSLANRNKYELQLKGAGKTPFSRFADGKAVLRSSIREYIISEHLHAIGIPSTRALSLTYLPKTYAQRHRAEKCAIVSRFAELWVRLGSFDLYRWRSDRNGIRELADYVINELFTVDGEKFIHFQEISGQNDFFNDFGPLTDYDKMYYEAVIRNASTTALWQCYGFLNGVLNTDNTSILGLSMDFGPFSILDKFDPNFTSNSEDHELRYSYKNTPTSIWWNLTRFGEDLAELLGAGPELLNDKDFVEGNFHKEWEDQIIQRATKVIEIGGEIFQYTFTKVYVETFFNRLGLSQALIDKDPNVSNEELIAPMLDMLGKVQCDFNKFFLHLQSMDLEQDLTQIAEKLILPSENVLGESYYSKEELVEVVVNWLEIYKQKMKESAEIDPHHKLVSLRYNPVFLPRNWILDEVIRFTEETDGEDLSYLKKLEKMSCNPFDASKWGDEMKELEDKWSLQGDVGAEYIQMQCSCSS
jgi:uncharacterized protein YdiU (UPF0061 family)